MALVFCCLSGRQVLSGVSHLDRCFGSGYARFSFNNRYIRSKSFSVQPPSTSSVKTWWYSSGSLPGPTSSCRCDVFFLFFRIPPHLIILSWSYATITSGKTKIKTPSSPSSLQSLLTRPSQVSKFSSGRRSTWTRQVCVRFWRNGPTLPLITGSFLKRTARTLDVATFKESTIRVFHFWFGLISY